MTRGGRRTSGGNLRGGGNSTTRSGSGRRDPAWDHGVRVEGPNPDSSYVSVKCNYCPQTITGGINRFKNHLACNHDNARPCPNVPPEVKTEMINFPKAREDRKNMRHENFDFLVSKGSYYQGGGQGLHEEVCSGGGRGTSGSGRGPSGEGGSSHADYDRYAYGPMDRYMPYGNVEEHDDPSSERKLTPVNEKEQRRQLCKEIGRFFIDNSIPFNAAASPSFVSMVNAIIRHRRPFKHPSRYELRTWILMEEVKTVDAEVKKVRETWPSTGVTIMSDGWKDIRGRQLINFLVNNPEGTIFLKSVDASDAIKDANLMYKMLEEVVLDVGPGNVVQIVTDNASNYKATGKKLMAEYPTLYWTPCAAHCIDLMLGDLFKLPQLSNAYRNGKKLITFIYNHGWVLALMRKFTKKDLLRPAATRFGTAYLTLHSIFQNRAGLEQMFTSTAWLHSSWAKNDDGKAVRRIILRDPNFWPSVVYALKVTRPLIRVLRIVDADAPSMGYLYGSMDRAKEEVANNLDNELSKYSEIWSIIDKRWDDQLHRHLHAAAYYLNPQFFYEPNFSVHGEIQSGLYACMDKMILDKEEHKRVDLELDSYREKRGMLGRPSAMETRHSRTPIAWWNAYGADVPALKKFAIRILGLTCTSSACERNWSTFNQVHTKKRNRLSQSRLNALVYVMYNKRLGKKRQLRNMKVDASTADDDALERDEWESDDEWVQPPSSIQHEVVIGDEDVQGDGDGSHVTDPEPCPQWHEVIQNELDEEAIMAEIEAQVQAGGRKRKKKATSASGSGLTRRGGVLSLDRRGRSNPSHDRGRGAIGKGKGKSTFIVDEDEEDFVDVDEAGDEDEEDSFEELMGDDD